MKIDRCLSVKINRFLDQIIPPILRDSKIFMKPMFKLLFKDKANIFFSFKEKAFNMDEQEFLKTYKLVSNSGLHSNTDLNKGCINEILKSIKGKNVLEVGCGGGYLAKKIAKRFKITVTDILINKKLKKINFKKANIENLPFKKNEFDTVVCTHTLEHVLNINKAINELRRVSKKRLIIVVPKQRPYKYTFNLHLHFFPYKHSLIKLMGNKKSICKEISGDWFYLEDN